MKELKSYSLEDVWKFGCKEDLKSMILKESGLIDFRQLSIEEKNEFARKMRETAKEILETTENTKDLYFMSVTSLYLKMAQEVKAAANKIAIEGIETMQKVNNNPMIATVITTLSEDGMDDSAVGFLSVIKGIDYLAYEIIDETLEGLKEIFEIAFPKEEKKEDKKPWKNPEVIKKLLEIADEPFELKKPIAATRQDIAEAFLNTPTKNQRTRR